MSMANKIQKHWIALSKTKMLLRYLEKGNRIYDYKKHGSILYKSQNNKTTYFTQRYAQGV